MMHLTRLTLTLVWAGLTLVGCAEPGARVAYGDVAAIPRRHGDFVTPIDYYKHGQDRVRSFLSSKQALDAGGGLVEAINRCESSCVRVEARIMRRGTSHRANLGSGVLVDNGRYVLTAGHVVSAPVTPEILVTLMDGRVVGARIAACVYGGNEDWALLELESGAAGTDDAGTMGAADLGEPVHGELTVVIGYPEGKAGRTETGSIVADYGRGGRYLAPLTVIARVTQSSPLLLRPEAGVVPVGGMSGSPLIDRYGRVVAIFSAVEESFDAGGVTHSLRASPVDSALQWLTKAAESSTEEP